MNGKGIDSTSKEMRAIVAYIKWVGHDVKKGVIPQGAGIVNISFLKRAADSEKGNLIFQQKCVSCHSKDGQGKFNNDMKSYQYPPLWGDHSFNTGAGLFRLSRFAGYIKANMPFITSAENPMLTNEEAWDLAAYILSKPRPGEDISNDWPDTSKKPFDHPFGPYKDQFSESQHKFGPFGEMASARK